MLVEISNPLRSVLSATVESDDGSYTFEIPAIEVCHDGIQPGETYRIAVLEAGYTTVRSDTQSSDTSSERSESPISAVSTASSLINDVYNTGAKSTVGLLPSVHPS